MSSKGLVSLWLRWPKVELPIVISLWSLLLGGLDLPLGARRTSLTMTVKATLPVAIPAVTWVARPPVMSSITTPSPSGTAAYMPGGPTPPGGSTTLDVTTDGTGLLPGLYRASLCGHSNDPARPLLQVPVLTLPEFQNLREGVHLLGDAEMMGTGSFPNLWVAGKLSTNSLARPDVFAN